MILLVNYQLRGSDGPRLLLNTPKATITGAIKHILLCLSILLISTATYLYNQKGNNVFFCIVLPFRQAQSFRM